MNRLSALQCLACSMPFSSLPQSAFVETETDRERAYSTFGNEPYAPMSYANAYQEPSEIGRKTFYWYRVYCGALAALYALVATAGLFVAYIQPSSSTQSAEESLIMGLIYAIVGTIFFAVFLVASILPAKPYNWIVGIVMIAIGMTSCCMWPAVIPLLIYWIKPETREFFGRK